MGNLLERVTGTQDDVPYCHVTASVKAKEHIIYI